MPDTASRLTKLTQDRKLTDDELVAAVRSMLAAENESAQLYMQLAVAAADQPAAEVFKAIADDERAHAGECMRLLRELAHEEDKFYAEAAEVTEEATKKTP